MFCYRLGVEDSDTVMNQFQTTVTYTSSRKRPALRSILGFVYA